MRKKSILAAAITAIMLTPAFTTSAFAGDVTIGLVDTNMIIAKVVFILL